MRLEKVFGIHSLYKLFIHLGFHADHEHCAGAIGRNCGCYVAHWSVLNFDVRI